MIGSLARRCGNLPAVAALWLVLVVATLAGRPALPVDETRVLSVAWEMWSRQDFLVPYLNGAPYPHKPPLLPWLIALGWKLAGVNDIWPRLVAPLFALGSLWLTRRLAQQLWPEHREAAGLAPLFLLGTLFWATFSTGTLYDMLLTFFALAGGLGLVHAWQRGLAAGFAVFGIALGLGLLSKGPVIMLHLGIPAVLAPLWAAGHRPNWARWYLGVAGALALGLVIAGCWAIPAARSGGEAYAQAILWSQTADRMTSSFAHQQPFWWYLPLLPLLLFPWIAWPALWRALRRMLNAPLDPGSRLTLVWSGAGLLAFSAISGKQPHYLLPLFPALALLAARAACALPALHPRDVWPPAFGIALLGASLLAIRYAGPRIGLPDWSAQLPLETGIAVAGTGIALILIKFDSVRLEAFKLAAAAALVVAVCQAGASQSFWNAYDLRPVGAWLKGLEARGVPLAHVGPYHGQYHYLGRLTGSLQVMPTEQLADWFARHPDGRAIVYTEPGDPVLTRAEFSQRFRSRALAIIDLPVYRTLTAQ